MPESRGRLRLARSHIDDAIDLIINDPLLRRRIAIDPETAIATLGLSATERALLLSWLHDSK